MSKGIAPFLHFAPSGAGQGPEVKTITGCSKWFAPPTITCSTSPRKKLVLALPNFGYYIS
jgi:hypothetical protein